VSQIGHTNGLRDIFQLTVFLNFENPVLWANADCYHHRRMRQFHTV